MKVSQMQAKPYLLKYKWQGDGSGRFLLGAGIHRVTPGKSGSRRDKQDSGLMGRKELMREMLLLIAVEMEQCKFGTGAVT